MSKKKHLSLRFTSALLCMTILTGGMAANWTPIRDIPVSAKTLAELQEERKSNEKKIAEKQKELDSLQSDLEEKEAYQKTLQEKSPCSRAIWTSFHRNWIALLSLSTKPHRQFHRRKMTSRSWKPILPLDWTSSRCGFVPCTYRATTVWLRLW